MSNADTNTIELEQSQWSSKPLNEAQQKSRDAAALIPFGRGEGMTPQNFAQAVDFSKHMANAKGMLGNHLVGNYAGCLAIIELADQFGLKPFMLARQTYFVNGMIAFDGQAIMAIMNLHLELEPTPDGKKGQLQYEFFGDKGVYEPVEIEEMDRNDMPTGKKVWVSRLVKPSTRWVRVTGLRKNEATPRVYESPPVFQIKNKKSPLWEEDEDQQLTYWASRRWQRKHWPEGMIGILDREEASQMFLGADNAKLITDSDPGKALLERIAATKAQTDNADHAFEGFSKDHAHNETTHGGTTKSDVADQPSTENVVAAASDGGPEPVASDQHAEATAPGTNDEPESIVLPKTVADWKVYALAWINDLGLDPKATAEDMNKRWRAETSLRNDCGVSGAGNVRDEVYDVLLKLREDKPAAGKAPAKKKTK